MPGRISALCNTAGTLRRFGGNGGQSPKSEIRNPKQIRMKKGASPQNQVAAGGLTGRVLRISHLDLVLVSDFEFRTSDLSLQGSGVQPKRCGTCSAPQRGEGAGEGCGWPIAPIYARR